MKCNSLNVSAALEAGCFRENPCLSAKTSQGSEYQYLDPFSNRNRDSYGTAAALSDNTLYEIVRELSERKKMLFTTPIPGAHYRECTLCTGKDWFVSFYVINPETGKLKRIRMKINRIASIAERRRTARLMMRAINQRLAIGWNPLIEKVAPRGGAKLYEALDSFLAVKRKEMEPTSMRMYTSFVKTFKAWLEGHGYGASSLAASFTRESAVLFMDEVELKYTAKTYNNYLGFFKGLFGWMLEKGYAADNPFSKFTKKAKRLTQKQRRLLTDAELKRLFSFLEEASPEYLAICLLCYCCFIRPKEIVSLRCRDIDLQRHVVHVDASIAKNDRESYRTIPDDVLPVLRRLDLSSSELYVFGGERKNLFRPYNKMVCSREIARYWNQVVRPACDFPMELQFYSLKDTGITNALEEGIPINQVQQQADHSSVAMTAIYVGHKAKATEELRDVRLPGIDNT